MAKNKLGVDLNDGFEGDVLIDTDTGKIIRNDSDIMKKNQKTPEKGSSDEDEENLINIPDNGTEGDGSGSGNDDPAGGNDTSSLPSFKILVSALHEKGILSELKEEDIESMGEDDTEKLFELMKREIEKNAEEKVNEKLSSLPEDIKAMVMEGGAKAEAAANIIELRGTIKAISEIKEDQIEEDIDLQRNLVAEALRNRGYSDDRIKKRIKQFEDLGALEEEAKDAKEEVLELIKGREKTLVEEAELAEKKAKKEQEESLTKLKNDIFSSDHIIDGMKLTEKEKQVIYDSMTKVVEKDSAGNPLNSVMVTRQKNPLAFEKALHYYHALGLFNIDDEGNFKPDLSKIKMSAKKSAVDELSNVLKAEQRNNAGRPARETKMDKAKLKERLEQMKKAFPL